MASPQQPSPPSNPFDGFDNYKAVAQQPLSQLQMQPPGPQPHPPNQWTQQPTQTATATVQQQQQQQQHQASSSFNPFETLNHPPVAGNNTAPLSVPQVSLMQPPSSSPDMMTAIAMQRQQLVPMAPNTSAASPWALHPTAGQQHLMPMAPNANVQYPWGLQPGMVQQQLVPMPSSAIVQSPWAVQGVSFYFCIFTKKGRFVCLSKCRREMQYMDETD